MTKKIDKLAALRGCSVGAMIMVATNLGNGKTAEPKVQEKNIDQTENIIKAPQTPIIDNKTPDLPPDTIAPFRVIDDVSVMLDEATPNKTPKTVESQKPIDKNFDFNKDNSDYIEACQTYAMAYEERKNPDSKNLMDLAMAMKLQKRLDDMAPLTDALNKLTKNLEKLTEANFDADALKEIAKESKSNASNLVGTSSEIINNLQEDLKIFTESSKNPDGKSVDNFLDKSYGEAKKSISANDKEEKKIDSKTANQTPLSYAASKRMQNTY